MAVASVFEPYAKVCQMALATCHLAYDLMLSFLIEKCSMFPGLWRSICTSVCHGKYWRQILVVVKLFAQGKYALFAPQISKRFCNFFYHSLYSVLNSIGDEKVKSFFEFKMLSVCLVAAELWDNVSLAQKLRLQLQPIRLESFSKSAILA